MAPYLDQIAQTRQGTLLVAKADTDRSPDISARYHIRSIPFFGRFEHGQPVRSVIGAVGRAGLEELAG